MTGRTVFVVVVEFFTLCWWAVFVYSRRKARQVKLAEEAKYVVWDAAYKRAVRAGKTEYYALMDAVAAVKGGPAILMVWEDAYNKFTTEGVRKYRACILATAAARKAAHRHL